MPETMTEDNPYHYEITVTDDQAGARIDRWISSVLPAVSRTRAKALLEEGSVFGPHGPVTDPARRVAAGQSYRIVVPESPSAIPEPEPEPIPLRIVFEDAHIIVIDKPAGMVVHPAPGSEERTLVNALLAHCGNALSTIGGALRPGIVHRLDKDTSGLLIAAKTDQAHTSLAEQLAARTMTRQYRAVVWGVPSPRVGSIEGNIGRSPADRKRMAVLRTSGRPARTHYRVLQSFGTAAAEVECRLETGRTHQIRVHMASRGYPLIGDQTYGRTSPARRAAAARAKSALDFPRQALHAARLELLHPSDGRPLSFAADMPKDLQELICDLGHIRPD